MSARTDLDRSVHWGVWLSLLALVVFLAPVFAASPAAAHVELASSDPADGAVLDKPAAVLTLTFSQTAKPAGSGLRIVDDSGAAVAADVASGDGGVTWRLRPASPLGPGRYGVRWRIAAGDAHTMFGTVQFRVAGVAAAAGDSKESIARADDSSAPALPPADSELAYPAALEAGPDAEDGPWWGIAAAVGRWVSFLGVLVAVGALVVIVTTLVGSVGDLRLSDRVVRLAAMGAAAGSLVEGAAVLSTLGVETPVAPLTAVALRLTGGLALATSFRLVVRRTGGRRGHDVPTLRGAEHRGGGRTAQMVLTPPVVVGRVRGVPARPIAAGVGSAALLVSFLLDGHSTIVGPWPLIAAASLAHAAAAAVWVGGVVLLATLLLGRARAGVPTGAGELAVRFSIPATASVAVVGLAGAGLTVLILDSPSDLLSTPWGRALLVKLVLVTVVALLGYANNRYAVPALDAWRPDTARLLRRTVAIEGALMVAVVAVTAILVASQA